MNNRQEMLKFASSPENVSLVESFLESVVRKYRINPDMYGNILISLTEAVSNAIKHGNSYDQSKNVEVKLHRKQNKLAFRVSDEGQGFNYKDLPDPTAPENLLKVGGRGVFLMRQLADQVAFSNNGSTVEIIFSIQK